MSLGTRLKSTLEVISTIAVVLAAGALLWTVFNRPSASRVEAQIERLDGLRIEHSKITNVEGTGKLAIVEFSDFQCPFCARFVKETPPTIKRDFVDTGRVRYAAFHYPIESIHPLAMGASEAAECAGRQGYFWEMRRRLFETPEALTRPDLMNHAKALTLIDEARFNRCLEEHEAVEKVRADQTEAQRLGVTGTPAFFIGTLRDDGGIDLITRIRGFASVETLTAEISKLL